MMSLRFGVAIVALCFALGFALFGARTKTPFIDHDGDGIADDDDLVPTVFEPAPEDLVDFADDGPHQHDDDDDVGEAADNAAAAARAYATITAAYAAELKNVIVALGVSVDEFREDNHADVQRAFDRGVRKLIESSRAAASLEPLRSFMSEVELLKLTEHACEDDAVTGTCTVATVLDRNTVNHISNAILEYVTERVRAKVTRAQAPAASDVGDISADGDGVDDVGDDDDDVAST